MNNNALTITPISPLRKKKLFKHATDLFLIHLYEHKNHKRPSDMNDYYFKLQFKRVTEEIYQQAKRGSHSAVNSSVHYGAELRHVKDFRSTIASFYFTVKYHCAELSKTKSSSYTKITYMI